jgi:acyl homoserine lactone synthase
MGKVTAMAALLDCSQERIDRVRAFSGISHDLLLSDAEARALLDRKVAGSVRERSPVRQAEDQITAEDIRQYCQELADAAQDSEEKSAVRSLVAALVRAKIHPSGLSVAHG